MATTLEIPRHHSMNFVCPVCHDPHLQYEQVEVFSRDEDAKDGLHVRVTLDEWEHAYGMATIDTRLDGNPSARRGAVTLVVRSK